MGYSERRCCEHLDWRKKGRVEEKHRCFHGIPVLSPGGVFRSALAAGRSQSAGRREAGFTCFRICTCRCKAQTRAAPRSALSSHGYHHSLCGAGDTGDGGAQLLLWVPRICTKLLERSGSYGAMVQLSQRQVSCLLP